MDKQISKIKKDLSKGAKDTKKLMSMDKVQDKKVAKCDTMMKGKTATAAHKSKKK